MEGSRGRTKEGGKDESTHKLLAPLWVYSGPTSEYTSLYVPSDTSSVTCHCGGFLGPSNPGSWSACGQSVAITVVVDVAGIMKVVDADVGMTRSVKMTSVVEVVVAAKTVSVTDEIEVEGIVDTLVVLVVYTDSGMLRQEQAVEMADDSKSSRSWANIICGSIKSGDFSYLQSGSLGSLGVLTLRRPRFVKSVLVVVSISVDVVEIISVVTVESKVAVVEVVEITSVPVDCPKN